MSDSETDSIPINQDRGRALILGAYFPHEPDLVPVKAWPYVAHLNRLQRHCVYLERVLPHLRFYDSPFRAAFVAFAKAKGRMPSEEEIETFPPHDIDDLEAVRGLDWALAEIRSSSALLCEALCAVLPSALEVISSMFNDKDQTAGTLENGLFRYVEAFDHSAGPDIPRYLDCLMFATAKIQNLKTWLDFFERGYIADHYRRHRLERAASEAGKKSGKVRATQRMAAPAEVHEAAQKLWESGHPEHSIASTLAQRFHVSSDHIRRILRSPPI